MRLLLIYFIFLAFLDKTSTFGGYWTKTNANSLPCSANNHRLLSLFNLLCNTTQTTSIQTRDACYGCFFRASTIPSGTTQMSLISQCAKTYLSNTSYSNCGTEFEMVVNGNRIPSSSNINSCYTGYCDFVRCIRRINANNLIDKCFTENMEGKNFNELLDRTNFYTNVTSCILAKARCSPYNPITGEQQHQISYPYARGYIGQGPFYNQANFINALQISTAGDIRILTFPGTVNFAELFCSKVNNLEQSNYKNDFC